MLELRVEVPGQNDGAFIQRRNEREQWIMIGAPP
jgi:hypothetical protein